MPIPEAQLVIWSGRGAVTNSSASYDSIRTALLNSRSRVSALNPDNPLFPLAHLGLARAYTLQGHIDKSRAAYQDFFALWKDADPDIPILKQAKAEYAKLM